MSYLIHKAFSSRDQLPFRESTLQRCEVSKYNDLDLDIEVLVCFYAFKKSKIYVLEYEYIIYIDRDL